MKKILILKSIRWFGLLLIKEKFIVMTIMYFTYQIIG